MLEISLRYWCHKKDDTTQKSIGEAKFTSGKGLESKHSRWESAGVLSLTQCCPSLGSGRFWTHGLHGWLIGKRTSGGALETKKFKSSEKQ
jgi:hypothetical protein